MSCGSWKQVIGSGSFGSCRGIGLDQVRSHELSTGLGSKTFENQVKGQKYWHAPGVYLWSCGTHYLAELEGSHHWEGHCHHGVHLVCSDVWVGSSLSSKIYINTRTQSVRSKIGTRSFLFTSLIGGFDVVADGWTCGMKKSPTSSLQWRKQGERDSLCQL